MKPKKPTDNPEAMPEDDGGNIAPDISITLGEFKLCSRGRTLKETCATFEAMLKQKPIKNFMKQSNQLKFVNGLSNIPDYV